jgi:hypothetical protein
MSPHNARGILPSPNFKFGFGDYKVGQGRQLPSTSYSNTSSMLLRLCCYNLVLPSYKWIPT